MAKFALSQGGLRAQTKEIIAKVYDYFRKQFGDMPHAKQKTVQRVIDVIGISRSTVYRVIYEKKQVEKKESNCRAFSSPKKKIPHKRWITELDDFTACAIRRKVLNFQITEGVHISLDRLFTTLKNEDLFRGGRSSLHMIVTKLGFRWKRTEDNKRVLIEKDSLKLIRVKFLQKLKKLREEGKHIVYLDETYINVTHTHPSEWSNQSSSGLKKAGSTKGQRLIIAHAGGENGFIQNALIISRINTNMAIFDVNTKIFMKWMAESLIPNLPGNSVVVMDNSPYHNIVEKNLPKITSKKETMKNWLRDRNILFSSNMFKVELIELINRHSSECKWYKVDALLKSHGHQVLRLPPYHPDLNPIEKIWEIAKTRIASKNTTRRLYDVWSLIDNEFAQISPEEWKATCEHVKKIEDEYMDTELRFDAMLENINIIIKKEESTDDEVETEDEKITCEDTVTDSDEMTDDDDS